MRHNITVATNIADSLDSFDINTNMGLMLHSAKGHFGLMDLGYYGIAVVYADLLLPLLLQTIQSWRPERIREMGPWLCFAIPRIFCTVTLRLIKKLRSTPTGKLLILTATVITVVSIVKCKCFEASQLWSTLVTASQIAFLLLMVLCSFLNASHVAEQPQAQTQGDPDSRVRREEEAQTLFWGRAQTNCSQHCGNMYQQQIPTMYLPATKNQLTTTKWPGMQKSFSYVIACWPGPSYPNSSCSGSICGVCEANKDPGSSCLSDESHSQCRKACNMVCCTSTACRLYCCSIPYECHLVCCFDSCSCTSYKKKQRRDVTLNESGMPYETEATAVCSYCCCCWCGFCCSECCYCSSSDAAVCGGEHVGVGDDSGQPKLRKGEKATDTNSQNRKHTPTQPQREFSWKWGQLATPEWDQRLEPSEDVRLQLTMQYHRNLLALQYIVHVATATPSYRAPLGFGSTLKHTTSVKSSTCSLSQQHMQLLFHLQQRDICADYHRQLLISCCVAGEQHLKTNNLCNIFSNNRKRHRRRCLRRRRQHRLRQAHKKKLNPCGTTLGIHPKNEIQEGCALSGSQLSKCSKVNRSLWKEGKLKRSHQRIGNFQKTMAINILKAITGIISLSPPFLSSDAPHTTTSATRTAVRLRFSLSASCRSTSILHAQLDASTFTHYPLVWATTTTISISTPTPPTSFTAAIPSTTRIIRRRVKSNLVWLFIGLVWFESPKLITCNIVTASVNSVQSNQQHESHEVSHHQESSAKSNQRDEAGVAMESQQQQLLLLPWTVSKMHQLGSGLRDLFTSKVNCSNTFKTNHEKRQAILQTQLKHHKVTATPQGHFNPVDPVEKPLQLATPLQPPQSADHSPEMQSTKIRSRRYFTNQQEINYSNEFDKQEQVSTNLNDLARLESIKRQILSKLGLSHKPNVMHPLPKQFIWDTIYRADGIKSVNDFDFIVANREGGHRAYSPFQRRPGGVRNRPHSSRVQPNSGIGNDRYDNPDGSHQRNEYDHRMKHSMQHPAGRAKDQIPHAPYHHNRNSPENDMPNTHQEATTQYSRAYYNNTYHTDSKHKLHNANASVTETQDRRYDAHTPGYYSNSENQNKKINFQSSKSATYLFSNTTDGDVGRNSSKTYIGFREADDALGGVGHGSYSSRRQENRFIGFEDHVEVPSHPYRESGTEEQSYPSESEMSDSDFHLADNDDFFGSTQEIITFAEKGTVFWHHRLVEFSKQRSVIPNQRLFIRNAEIHIRIDRIKPQSKTSVPVERRKRKLREPGNLNIWIFQLIDTNYTQKAFDKVTRLSAAYTVDTRQLGWQKLDITKSVQEWYSSSNQKSDKLRLLIDCSGCGKHYVLHLLEPPNEFATVQPKGKPAKQKQIKNHPLLPMDAIANRTRDDGTFSLLWEHSGNKSYRYKYYSKVTKNINANNNIKDNLKRIQHEYKAATGYQESNPNRPFIVLHTESKRVRRVRRRAIDCLGASHGQCCKESFYVSFKQLGWDDWIIAPRGYFANYCRGDCTRPFRTPDTFQTFHAHFIEEYRKMGLLNGMQPCCAPIKFSSMSLIYYGDEGIIKRDLPKMVVDECGCP